MAQSAWDALLPSDSDNDANDVDPATATLSMLYPAPPSISRHQSIVIHIHYYRESHSCKPWSRRALARRVASFAVSTWFAKPPSLSPLVCARFGWCNVSTDMLACDVCHRRIYYPSHAPANEGSATPPPPTAAEVLRELEEGHDGVCPWLGNPSPPRLVEPQPLTRPQWSREAQRILETLAAHAPPLPAPAVAPALTAAVEKAFPGVLAALLREVAHFNPTLETVYTGQLSDLGGVTLLPMAGWAVAAPRHGDATAQCLLCQRRLLLDHYRPAKKANNNNSNSNKEADPWGFLESEEEEGGERSAKRARPLAELDALAEHRPFCPYAQQTTALALVKEAVAPTMAAAPLTFAAAAVVSGQDGTTATEGSGGAKFDVEATLARIRSALRPAPGGLTTAELEMELANL